MNITCVVCGAPLTGGSDTFGEIHNPICQQDYFDLWAEQYAIEQEKAQRLRDRRHMLASEMEALRSEIQHVDDEIGILVTLGKRHE